MKNETKIFIAICVIVILLGAGFLSGYAVRKTVDNKSIREYRSTIDNLRSKLIEQADTNIKLAETNAELREQLEQFRIDLEKAKGIIDEIRKGISGDLDTISRIRKAIRSVIQAIEQLGKTE